MTNFVMGAVFVIVLLAIGVIRAYPTIRKTIREERIKQTAIQQALTIQVLWDAKRESMDVPDEVLDGMAKQIDELEAQCRKWGMLNDHRIAALALARQQLEKVRTAPPRIYDRP